MDTKELRMTAAFLNRDWRSRCLGINGSTLEQCADEIDRLREERERVRAWIESTCPEGAAEEAFRQDPEQTPNL